MLQIVNTPTHIQGNVLDLIFSNYPNLFTNLTVVPSYSVSHLISIHLSNSCPPVNPPHFVWNYSKADLEGLQSYLFDRNFDACLQFEDVNDIWSHIKEHIYDPCQLFVPRVKCQSLSPKWFNPEIRYMQKKTLALRHRYNRSRIDHTLSKINHTESLLQDLIISSKIDYEHHLVSNYHSEPGKLFDYLKNLSNSTSSYYLIFHNTKLVSILLNKKPRCSTTISLQCSQRVTVVPPENQLPC